MGFRLKASLFHKLGENSYDKVKFIKPSLNEKFLQLSCITIARGDEWSLRAFASMPSTAIFFASTSRNKKNCFACLRAKQKFGEHEQASTRLNSASKSSKGKILRAVKNLNGPFITPIAVKKKRLKLFRA